MRFARYLPALLLFATACKGDDESCVTTDDCFQGEVCVAGACELPDPSSNGSNGTTGGDAGNNTTGEDVSNGTGGVAPQCVVDPFGNNCEDDEYEPNDTLGGFGPLLFDNQSWCSGTELVSTQTSEPLTLCAGNDLDTFRLMIDNRNPNNCLTQQFTWKIDVRVETPCARELLNIEPYFSSPRTEERCVEDENFRCTWSADGQTFTVEYVRQPDQIMDFNLVVEAVGERDDVQIAYDVVMTLTQ